MQTNNELQHNPSSSCHLCGSAGAESSAPIVPDCITGQDKWICARCWLNRTYSNPDVQFVLSVLDRFIPEREKATRGFHHTLEEWSQAVLSVRSLAGMRAFFRGYTFWRIGPEVSPKDAEKEARSNIGCPLNDASWWTRIKWQLACGIGRSDYFYM